jgi:hypothetical protein
MTHKYDVAVSFAGEDRHYVEKVVALLKLNNVSVFYDFDFQHELWGEDLYTALMRIYSQEAKYCIPFISKDYKNKTWTRHEVKSAFSRAIEEKVYILPVRLDDTRIEGIPDTVGYVDLRKCSIEYFVGLILKKLGKERLDQSPEVAIFSSKNSQVSTIPKLSIFNNIQAVRHIVDKVGIGQIRPWIKYDSLEEWGCSTSYFIIKKTTDLYGIEKTNNIAIYLESDNENFIRLVKIVLDIHNVEIESESKEIFIDVLSKFFNLLGISVPVGLFNCINRGRKFDEKFDKYTVKNYLQSSNIDTWIVSIESP